mmetsp:Transcript_61958/g.160724  ORF Transcript_61958/g.160724 Transcript_61958/m.160724 type:complete len:285 (+) Transcript_61958:125-979(+)
MALSAPLPEPPLPAASPPLGVRRPASDAPELLITELRAVCSVEPPPNADSVWLRLRLRAVCCCCCCWKASGIPKSASVKPENNCLMAPGRAVHPDFSMTLRTISSEVRGDGGWMLTGPSLLAAAGPKSTFVIALSMSSAAGACSGPHFLPMFLAISWISACVGLRAPTPLDSAASCPPAAAPAAWEASCPTLIPAGPTEEVTLAVRAGAAGIAISAAAAVAAMAVAEEVALGVFAAVCRMTGWAAAAAPAPTCEECTLGVLTPAAIAAGGASGAAAVASVGGIN